ncbi:hypothetical protein PILCRDRAFT_10575 [Piloderma croceum F 1598]|uniref:Uncharacterized protein n=1 Tax=Piloderma croceum (strain F 1598) TaxID=765440 RepID=A0A0C3BPE0_PILCF|nr:hypothetical protein PILCRDRAFT_10575 [Piloderma croceum F 1598]
MSYSYDSPEYAYDNEYADSYYDHAESDEIDEYEEGRYEPQGFDHGGDRTQELRELGYKDEVAYRDGRKLRELEHEGGFKNTTPEYETTEELTYEPEYSTRANHGTYVPQGSKLGDYETPQHGHKGMIGYVHPDHLPHPPQVPTTPIAYYDHHPPPTYVPPISFSFSPTPSSFPLHTPHARNAPYLNQQGFERDGMSEHEGLAYHNVRTTNGAFTLTQLIYHEESDPAPPQQPKPPTTLVYTKRTHTLTLQLHRHQHPPSGHLRQGP